MYRYRTGCRGVRVYVQDWLQGCISTGLAAGVFMYRTGCRGVYVQCWLQGCIGTVQYCLQGCIGTGLATGVYRYRNDFCRDVYVQGHGCRDVQYCIGTRMAAIGTLLAAGMYMGTGAGVRTGCWDEYGQD